jgi:hypothetical protein
MKTLLPLGGLLALALSVFLPACGEDNPTVAVSTDQPDAGGAAGAAGNAGGAAGAAGNAGGAAGEPDAGASSLPPVPVPDSVDELLRAVSPEHGEPPTDSGLRGRAAREHRRPRRD